MEYLGTNKHGFKRYRTSKYEQERKAAEKRICQIHHYYMRAKQRFALTSAEARQLARQHFNSRLGFTLSRNRYVPVLIAPAIRAVIVFNMQSGNPITIMRPPCIQGRLFLAIMKDLRERKDSHV